MTRRIFKKQPWIVSSKRFQQKTFLADSSGLICNTYKKMQFDNKDQTKSVLHCGHIERNSDWCIS